MLWRQDARGLFRTRYPLPEGRFYMIEVIFSVREILFDMEHVGASRWTHCAVKVQRIHDLLIRISVFKVFINF